MSVPLISVCIPVVNGENFISESIDHELDALINFCLTNQKIMQ